MKTTAVLFELFEETIRIASWEALTCAIDMTASEGDNIKLITIGSNPGAAASRISEITGRHVTAIDIGGNYNSERTKSILVEICREFEITNLCLAGTTQGLDYAPGLAARLKKQCFTGVEAILRSDTGLQLKRSVYGGKVMEKCAIDESGAVIVIQPGTFKPFDEGEPKSANIDLREDSTPSELIRNIEVRQVQKESSALAEAPVIIAAGRGIREVENLELIEKLAAVFPKSAVGGSRPLCDLKWLEYKQQVGITGATVTPDLYLACGISGAAQHISGMRNAGLIVSINIDAHAAIFNHSDVCIVEDLTTFIPTFVETVEKHSQS